MAMDPRNGRSRTRAGLLSLALSLAFLPGCSDSPTGTDGVSTEDLVATLAVTPDHVHIYENVVTFTVTVEDPDGDPVTDFDLVQVERRLVGDDSWQAVELDRDGSFYVGTHTFEVSGDYDIRVTGLRPSDTELVVLYESPQPLQAVRAHAEVGGYIVELEPDPGHIHEGDTPTVRFWILDPDDESPISGLDPTIRVEESDGALGEYSATEPDPGIYVADHTFGSAGTADVGIRFLGADEQEHEWSLEIEIHPAH